MGFAIEISSYSTRIKFPILVNFDMGPVWSEKLLGFFKPFLSRKSELNDNSKWNLIIENAIALMLVPVSHQFGQFGANFAVLILSLNLKFQLILIYLTSVNITTKNGIDI